MISVPMTWHRPSVKASNISYDIRNRWDGISVPQRDRELQKKAVGSLCFYCQICTRSSL